MESRYSGIFLDLATRLMSEHEVVMATLTSGWSDAEKKDLEEAMRQSIEQFDQEIMTATGNEEGGVKSSDRVGEDDDRERILQSVAGKRSVEISIWV